MLLSQLVLLTSILWLTLPDLQCTTSRVRCTGYATKRLLEFSSECFAETLLCYIFAFCYYHLLFCCKMYILHLLKIEKIQISAQPRISAHLE